MTFLGDWLDRIYHPGFQFVFTAVALVLLALFAQQPRHRRLVLALVALLYARYMLWRGWYTLNLTDWPGTIVSLSVFGAELYGLFQFGFFLYQVARPTRRRIPTVVEHPSVDLFVTIVDEPLDILRRTLVGCLAQDYPKDRVQIYVLDDGHREEVAALSAALGCRYVRRVRRVHAKAGNLNHALLQSSGALVAVFDVDHVPSRDFLQKTIGFFQDPEVAFVQSRHHFYNPDVFQRNLKLERQVQGEQDMFFQLVQAGRDRYNSAFFAGSTGLFRRTHLDEVGGFQTDTITEDLHTSLLLHARGYKSCYVNEPLSAGLMPETFASYLKQRTRWAIGATQVWMRDNPLFIRGLTWAQRVNYTGSIYYFFLGLPRIIYLAAPLAWLFFGIPALFADAFSLVQFFFSYYVGSAIAMRVMTRGTRNAFWSDVYETAMCFALTRAVVRTLLAPMTHRLFEVTPKGQRIDQRGLTEWRLLWPHLMMAGLLVAGIVMGIRQWMRLVVLPGLEVSLFWAVANLVLVLAAIYAAYEQPQLRSAYRVPREYVCEIGAGEDSVPATTTDIHEGGLSAVVSAPIIDHRPVPVHLTDDAGRLVSLKGKLVRQEPLPDGQFSLGVKFVDLTEDQRGALIRRCFAATDRWKDLGGSGVGAWQSLRLLLTTQIRAHRRLRPRQRRIPRVHAESPCRLHINGRILNGHISDLSYTGLGASFRGVYQFANQSAILEMGDVILNVQIARVVRHVGTTRVGFRVRSVQVGGQQWRAVHQNAPPGPPQSVPPVS